MLRFSKEELQKRNAIIQSQLLLGNFLNTDVINRLIHLFYQIPPKNGSPQIHNYIEDERKVRGLDPSIIVTNEVHSINSDNSTLHLQLKKDGIDFIHLTIHLVVHTIHPQDSGMIHIAKNIYKKKNSRSTKIKSYAIILVEQQPGKPDSLHFSIGDGYNTPHVKNANIYDPIIQQEMNVIIDVLNRLFDEDNKEFYIGIRHRDNTNYVNNHYKLYEPHKLTNTVLQNMNMHSKYNTRRNKGRMMLPFFYNNTTFVINENTYRKLPIKKGKRVTSRQTRL